ERAARRQRWTVAVALRIGEDVELVFVRRPNRQAYGLGFIPLLRECRPAEVGCVKRRVLRRVVELVRGLTLGAPFAKRSEEPQTILPDRSTERETGVVDVVERVHAL